MGSFALPSETFDVHGLPICTDEKRRQEARQRAEVYGEGGDGVEAIKEVIHEHLDR